MNTVSVRAPEHAFALTPRIAAWLAVCVIEALAVSFVIDVPPQYADWTLAVYYARQSVNWVVVTGAAAVLIAWHERSDIVGRWQSAHRLHDWRKALAFNLALFAGLITASVVLMQREFAAAPPPPYWFALFFALLGAVAVSLLRLDIPLSALAAICWRYRVHLAAAAAAGLTIVVLANLAQDGWSALAGATLELSRSILSLYESDIQVDPVQKTIRIGNFAVRIWQNCSGYEGIALVVAFVSIYLWTFRATLRFPHALLLFPIGIATIWILNAVRIAALISIGAHISPAVAVQGFHSQAGWIGFLAVTLGLIALANASPWLSRAQRKPRQNSDRNSDRILLAYLAPFIALMLTSIVAATAAPHDRPFYGLKVAAVGLTLWYYRDVYRGLVWRVSAEALFAGALVGVAWVLTAPATNSAALGAWLAQLSVPVALTWLMLRVVGSVVVVPLAEELAFRGFLYRWIVARQFETVSPGHIHWLALIVSSLAFGALHDRWLAAALSGVVFAMVMWRSRRLSDPIIAHATANAVICAWAIAARQWSLL